LKVALNTIKQTQKMTSITLWTYFRGCSLSQWIF
jgi:hypothetical protein